MIVAAQYDAALAAVNAATVASIASFAKEAHAGVMRDDPHPLNFVRHVNGIEGAAEETIRPGGVIVYDYNRLDLIAKDALRLLRELSPVGTKNDPHPGLYRDSHELYLNSRPVDDLSHWEEGDEISITNTVPYARVIELGNRGSRKLKIDKGGRVYQRVQQILRRDPDTQRMAKIEFTYRAVLGGGQVNQFFASRRAPVRNSHSGRFESTGGASAHNVSEARWPTIVINPPGSYGGRTIH
jgi:hypothetical protein